MNDLTIFLIIVISYFAGILANPYLFNDRYK